MARNPGPTADKTRCFAERSASIGSCAIAPVQAHASTHITERAFTIGPTLIRMNLQITTVPPRLPLGPGVASVDAEAEALDGARAQTPGRVARPVVISFDQHAIHLHVPGSHLKPRRQPV